MEEPPTTKVVHLMHHAMAQSTAFQEILGIMSQRRSNILLQFHKWRGTTTSDEVLKREKLLRRTDKAEAVASLTPQSYRQKRHAIHSQEWAHGAGSIHHGETSRFC